MEEKKNNFITEEEIKSSEEGFRGMMNIPAIIAVLTGIAFFVFGCTPAMRYGGFSIAIWIVGICVCGAGYYIMKAVLTYFVLKIAYLREIKDKLNPKEEKVVTEQENQN